MDLGSLADIVTAATAIGALVAAVIAALRAHRQRSSSVMSPFSPIHFADENTLGFAKILQRSGRTDVLSARSRPTASPKSLSFFLWLANRLW